MWALLLPMALACFYAAALAAEFWLLRRIAGLNGASVPTIGTLAFALYREYCAGIRVFCWQQPFRSQRHPDVLPSAATATGQRGVVMVHGYLCNRGLWNRWLVTLRAAEIPFIAVDLQPTFASISDYAPSIEAAVVRLQEATGLAPLLVAHSMGGLAVRYWWTQTTATRGIHLVTLGTPHRGTWLARWGFSTNAREMRIGSTWLADLERRETTATALPVTCLFSVVDNVVFPHCCALLPRASAQQMSPVGHIAMLDDPAAFQLVLNLLGEGAQLSTRCEASHTH